MAASKTDAEPRTIEEALDGLLFAMITTSSPDGLSSRPVTLLDTQGATLRFLVSRGADWVRGIEGAEPVSASFADPKKNTYVSLSGTARVNEDPALVKELWNPAATIYFDGPDDPDAVTLEVDVTAGEWWDGPSGRVGQALSMAAAFIKQDPGPEGDTGTIVVP